MTVPVNFESLGRGNPGARLSPDLAASRRAGNSLVDARCHDGDVTEAAGPR
jgi:hypothetical protein